MTSFFTFLSEQPVLFLFILIGLGMAVGHIKLRSVTLGAAAVLFVAIIFGAVGQSLGVMVSVPEEIGVLGLALFAFAIGINSGASFFQNLRKAVGAIITMAFLFVVTAVIGFAVGKAMGLETSTIVGTFAGAVTNTPALAAGGDASGDEIGATIGYSIAYLFGVVGMLAASMSALSYGKHDRDAPSPIVNRTIRVEREDKPTIGDVFTKYDGKVTFSRLRRGETGPIMKPSQTDSLDADDLVTVVGPRELIAQVAKELGHPSSHSLIEDRSYLDFRRMTISNSGITGKRIAELDLGRQFSATISRIRRGDVDLAASPNLILQQGDRVRIVAPKAKMRELGKFFGDSARGLTDLNPIALGLGMALGILLGEFPIFTPTGEYFTIGSAAGTLIVGLIFGRIRRIGPLVTAIPYTSCLVLAELGLLLFLARAGANAGAQILSAFTGGVWWKIAILGVIMTSIMGVGLYCAMRWIFRMGGTRLSGLLAGAQTQPAILAFANSKTNFDPRVALGYALVYPFAMILKILVAQVMGVM